LCSWRPLSWAATFCISTAQHRLLLHKRQAHRYRLTSRPRAAPKTTRHLLREHLTPRLTQAPQGDKILTSGKQKTPRTGSFLLQKKRRTACGAPESEWTELFRPGIKLLTEHRSLALVVVMEVRFVLGVPLLGFAKQHRFGNKRQFREPLDLLV